MRSLRSTRETDEMHHHAGREHIAKNRHSATPSQRCRTTRMPSGCEDAQNLSAADTLLRGAPSRSGRDKRSPQIA